MTSVPLGRRQPAGRSIELYRVGGGESCILSTLSILTHEQFPALAVTEEEASVVLVPAVAVRSLIDTDAAWRDFAFRVYQNRLAGLITLIEEVVFARLDVRLAELLLAQSTDGSQPLQRTHQEIAATLGSSREVVSRLLKEWERRGVVTLARGRITISNRIFLREIRGNR